ncbi:hypothetical protein VTN00DRAFT_7021 [Thermoascus crustaceus]|uniref:uncharacterized protein n=1 Tax=Thermoascus crustaceus TaxID=5088 RepID=UPI003743F15A
MDIATVSPDTPPESSAQNENPASLLWAHEIRRENIHLVDRIEGMGVTLASTAEMALTLKTSVAELATLVEQLAAENRELRNELKDVQTLVNENRGLRNELRDIETRLGTRIECLDPRVGMLEDEHAEFKASLENAGSIFSALIPEQNRAVEQTRREIMDEVKRLIMLEAEAPRSNGRRVRDLARAGTYVGYLAVLYTLFIWWLSLRRIDECPWTCGPENMNNRDDPDFVVPDSVPLDESIPPSAQPVSEHGVTNGENEQPSLELVDQDFSQEQQTLPTNHSLPDFEQNGRSLAEYFSSAEKVWTRMPRRGREKGVIVSFCEGLTDERVRDLLEKKMDEDGWTWDVLSEVCRGMATENEDDLKITEAEELQRKLEGMKRSSRDGKVAKPKKKRKRRCISLVPTDESDLMILYN